MTPADILPTYERFRELRARHGDSKLPKMRRESVLIHPVSIQADPMSPEAGAAKLDRQVADFAPDSGWLCFQSEVLRIHDGQLPGPDEDRGLPLSGELVNGAGESLHLRQNGRGGWIVTRFTPEQGKEYLVDDCSLIAHESNPERRRDPGQLCYRRYWCLDPHHGVRQAAARFIGFIGLEEER
jgi:hypothetical protein